MVHLAENSYSFERIIPLILPLVCRSRILDDPLDLQANIFINLLNIVGGTGEIVISATHQVINWQKNRHFVFIQWAESSRRLLLQSMLALYRRWTISGIENLLLAMMLCRAQPLRLGHIYWHAKLSEILLFHQEKWLACFFSNRKLWHHFFAKIFV
jgi:hypothetical protein